MLIWTLIFAPYKERAKECWNFILMASAANRETDPLQRFSERWWNCPGRQHFVSWGADLMANVPNALTAWIQGNRNWEVNIKCFYSCSNDSRPNSLGALNVSLANGDTFPLGRGGGRGWARVSPELETETFSGPLWALPARK